MRGNRGGVKPSPMCNGCGKHHWPRTDMTRALDGRDYCNRNYWPARERIAAATRIPNALPENPEGQSTPQPRKTP